MQIPSNKALPQLISSLRGRLPIPQGLIHESLLAQNGAHGISQQGSEAAGAATGPYMMQKGGFKSGTDRVQGTQIAERLGRGWA